VVTGLEIEDVDHAFQPIPGTARVLPADLVLLAMGFTGPEQDLPTALGLAINARGTVEVDQDWRTSTDGVFACGDAARGQSLIVWAIAEGRSCAAAVDAYLMGGTELPAPIVPGQRALA